MIGRKDRPVSVFQTDTVSHGYRGFRSILLPGAARDMFRKKGGVYITIYMSIVSETHLHAVYSPGRIHEQNKNTVVLLICIQLQVIVHVRVRTKFSRVYEIVVRYIEA